MPRSTPPQDSPADKPFVPRQHVYTQDSKVWQGIEEKINSPRYASEEATLTDLQRNGFKVGEISVPQGSEKTKIKEALATIPNETLKKDAFDHCHQNACLFSAVNGFEEIYLVGQDLGVSDSQIISMLISYNENTLKTTIRVQIDKLIDLSSRYLQYHSKYDPRICNPDNKSPLILLDITYTTSVTPSGEVKRKVENHQTTVLNPLVYEIIPALRKEAGLEPKEAKLANPEPNPIPLKQTASFKATPTLGEKIAALLASIANSLQRAITLLLAPVRRGREAVPVTGSQSNEVELTPLMAAEAGTHSTQESKTHESATQVVIEPGKQETFSEKTNEWVRVKQAQQDERKAEAALIERNFMASRQVPGAKADPAVREQNLPTVQPALPA